MVKLMVSKTVGDIAVTRMAEFDGVPVEGADGVPVLAPPPAWIMEWLGGESSNQASPPAVST